MSEAGLAYADGAESRLAQIVGAARDLSSWSEELALAAEDWGTSYSLVPARANVLRALDLTADMAVLEIGCGNGPITRYLGETCGTVDAVEPMAARATVASLRTRDLDTVEVFVGTLDDVPKVPTYDVVVVVGVLEYVGSGSADAAPYLGFLRDCHAVLRDGGSLVLAIENALGVKYIAGAAEDHTNRPFDSLEGYALWSPARTFTRRELTTLISDAGFTPCSVLGAFPDYKLPRAILADDIFRDQPQLATTLPRFPSPDYLVPRLNLADEGLTWRTLVSAGVAEHFSNSFITVSSKGRPAAALWPGDRLGLLLNTARRPAYSVRAEVRRGDSGPEFVRDRLFPAASVPASSPVRHQMPKRELAATGSELVVVMAREPERRSALLRRWLAMVPADGEVQPVDLVPHNLIVAPDGSLVAIDQEWWVRGYRRTSVLVRGLFLGAQALAQTTRPEVLAPWVSVDDAMQGLAVEAGFVFDEAAWDDFVTDEAAFQASVMASEDRYDEVFGQSGRDMAAMRKQSLADVRGGERFDVQWATAVRQLSSQAAEFERFAEERRSLIGAAQAAEQALQEAAAGREIAERDLEHVLRRSLFGLFVRARRWWQRGRAERAQAR